MACIRSGPLGEMEREAPWGRRCAASPGHRREGGELLLEAERSACPGAATLPREALRTRHGTTEMPCCHLSCLSQLSSSLRSSSGLLWCFPARQERRWVPLIHPRENECYCVSFLFHMERQSEGGADGCSGLEGE